jgi:hypothetical protein
MEQALEPRREVLIPYTGETVDLASSPDKLAAVLYEIRDLESRLREAKGELTEELLKRMDANARWSDRFGEFQVTGKSPEPTTEYDGERLFDALRALHDQGHISLEAAEAALEKETTYKPRKRGINALLKLGGEVAEAIKDCEVEAEPKRRYLKVERATKEANGTHR